MTAVVALWTPNAANLRESSNAQKRRVVKSIPPAILALADKLPRQTVQRRGIDWLEALVVEQLAAERLVQQRGRRVHALPPSVLRVELAALNAGRCGRILHRWGTVRVKFAGVKPATAPQGWDVLEFTCATCGKSCASFFLVERDVERGAWLRISFLPGLGAPEAGIVLEWPASGFDALGSPRRHLYTLATAETLEIESLAVWLSDPVAFPGKITRRYLPDVEPDDADPEYEVAPPADMVAPDAPAEIAAVHRIAGPEASA